ncbi:MAG: hypothetical protein IPL95_19240 [Saprospiraceae bacterium]|nr:hypothetical protein [Saprospiraceae bacterium]
MLDIFSKIGYYLNTIGSENEIALSCINNLDGSPRWIWNLKSSKPHFLKFYNVSSLKSKIFYYFVKIVFFLKLQSLVFQKSNYYFTQNGSPLIDLKSKDWALFLGTPGPNNKAVLYNEATKESAKFYKIPTTENSSKLVKNEQVIFDLLSSLNIEKFNFPKSKMLNNGIIELEDISKEELRCTEFSSFHADALIELYKKTGFLESLKDSKIWYETRDKLQTIVDKKDSRIPNGLLNKLHELMEQIENKEIIFALNHVDFTPWNQFISNQKSMIYDWELAKNEPIGFDAFHFIFQQGILVERLPWKSIKTKLSNKNISNIFHSFSIESENKVKEYLQLYLIINTINNLEIFVNQQDWHVQINWLLNTWNEALNDYMPKNNHSRKLVISDIFDFLHNKEYAALKFPNSLPTELSEYSDIDLVINELDANLLVNFLKQHSLVKHLEINKLSNMSSLQIITIDGSLLNIDLIWKIKRKQLEMMQISDILKTSKANIFGVKLPSDYMLAKFVGLFYGLNGAKIPSTYQYLITSISDSSNEIDKLLYVNYLQKDIYQNELIKLISKEPSNKGLNGLKNSMNYYIDVLKSYFKKGMIITFSGVDGAGKSTIIDKVKYEFEKKYRKKVIVRRHRPSLLPILSAWTKGKSKAEHDAANRLPRQGDNASFLSSFLRFCYYYFDYFFGQFYIYCRYVLAGYVVLYDRYYFDFINDCKRSNINLPKGITKFGYLFIKNPNYNFFLFASPEIILSRKQELDKSTILELTNEYQTLFKKLNDKGKSKYISLENIEMQATIDQILKITQAA